MNLKRNDKCSGQGSDVDDQPISLLPHYRKNRLDHTESAEIIDGKHRLRPFHGKLLERAKNSITGIVNQYIYPPGLPKKLRHPVLYRIIIRYIQNEKSYFLTQFLRQGIDFRGIPRSPPDLTTLLSQ